MLAAGLLLGSAGAHAQSSFPNRPVRLVSGFAPGGATDVVARVIAQSITDALGQPVIVDNRPGASGNIGADFVARSAPDGYTLYLANATIAMPSMFPKLSFDVKKDLAPVSMIAWGPSVLAVNPKLPLRSVKELIAYAQRNPGKLDYASGGIGNITHMSMELFDHMAKVDINHVPYKGGAPSTAAAVGGEVPVLMAAGTNVIGHVKHGTLVPLAVTGRSRTLALPDVPTIAESGVPGYEASSWYGIVVPANTPKPVIDKLDGAIRGGMQNKELREKLLVQGMDPVEMGPDEFGRFIRNEIDKWAAIIERAHIRAE
jgi:tripartite-type tricarboxylate transporter receptor subunit TctC